MAEIGLSQRLFLVVLAAVIPSLVAPMVTLISLRESAQRQLHADAAAQAQFAALEVERIFNGVESTLRTFDSAPVVMRGDAPACAEYASRITKALPQLQRIAVLDADGRIVCRSWSDGPDPDPALLAPLVAAAASEARLTGTYWDAAGIGVTAIPVAVARQGNGPWEGGVVVGWVPLSWLGERVKDRDFDHVSQLTIADRNGRILAREPDPEQFVGVVFPDEFLYLVAEPAPGTFEAEGLDGRPRVIGYVPPAAGPDGLYVSAGFISEAAQAEAARAMRSGVLLAVAGTIAALLLAWFTSLQFIRRPYQRLLATLEAAQRGDIGVRSGLAQDAAEFGRAGRALDAFLDAVETARAERREADLQRELVAGELDHRVKNLIATIQALARQTFRGKGKDAELGAFLKRLQAMGTAHTLLVDDRWQSAPVAELVERVTELFDNPGRRRFSVSGPGVALNARAAMALGMALHELCTNAAKYGALSTAQGQVQISWRLEGDDFRLDWTESGGPRVAPPHARGFGSTMIEQALASQLGGTVELRFPPDGVQLALRAPQAGVLAARQTLAPPASSAA